MNEFRSRRQFLNQNIKLLLAYGLAQSLWQRQAFSAPSSSSFEAWLSKVIDVGNKLLAGSIEDLQFQTEIDRLFLGADLVSLRKHIDFDRLTQNYDFGARGERFVEFDPYTGRVILDPPTENGRVVTKFAGVKRHAEIPAHGHLNTLSAFLILHGEFEAKTYDKIQTREKSLVFSPALHQMQKPGMWTALSESRSNIHQFKAVSSDSFFFSIKANQWRAGEPVQGRINLDMKRSREISPGVFEAPVLFG